MRVVLQRVRRASVNVDGDTVGEIGTGLLALVGVGRTSTAGDARWLADKTAGLRVFPEGGGGTMERSVGAVGGAVLAVSQVTLYADTSRGRRPSLEEAAEPGTAEELYELYCDALPVPVERGRFGALMDIDLVADGPVTIVLERASGEGGGASTT